jgi:hypothetical protein
MPDALGHFEKSPHLDIIRGPANGGLNFREGSRTAALSPIPPELKIKAALDASARAFEEGRSVSEFEHTDFAAGFA